MQRSSIIKNASFLFIAHFAGRILSFCLTIMLPRYLRGGFDDLGKFFFALWLTNLLATFMELGLHTPLIREVSADRSKAKLMISNALVIRLALSVVNFLIIAVLVRLGYSGEIATLIYVVGLSEIINALAQLFRCIFRSFENMGFEALGVILERFFVFSVGISVVILGYGIISFSVVVLIASGLNLAFTFLAMKWKFSSVDLGLLDARLCANLLKQSLPYAASGILYMAYFRLDGILLKHLAGQGGDLAIGWYGTGYSFVNALTIIPGAFMGAAFPVMSRTVSPDKREELVESKDSPSMDALYTKSLKLMLIMAFPLAIGVTFLADDIVLLLYPAERFSPRDISALSLILKILIWAGALLFLNTVVTTVLKAADRRRAFLIAVAASLCVNIGSNLILIPRYSYLGASVSMILSELTFFVFGSWYVQRYLCKISEFGGLLKSALASGLIALFLYAWKHIAGLHENIPFLLIAGIVIIVYSAIVIALGGITRADVAMIRGGSFWER